MFWRRQKTQQAQDAPRNDTTALPPSPVEMSVVEEPSGHVPDDAAVGAFAEAAQALASDTVVAAETTPTAEMNGKTGKKVKSKKDKAKPGKVRAEKAEKKGGGGAFGLGLVLGAAAGAAAALLFAPKSGEEMRSELVERGAEWRTPTGEPVSAAWQSATSSWQGTVADLKDKAHEVTHKAEATLRDMTHQAKYATLDTQAAIEGAAQDIKHAVTGEPPSLGDQMKDAVQDAQRSVERVADAAKNKAEDLADQAEDAARKF